VATSPSVRYDIKRLDLDYVVTDEDEPTSVVTPEVTPEVTATSDVAHVARRCRTRAAVAKAASRGDDVGGYVASGGNISRHIAAARPTAAANDGGSISFSAARRS
jgi:hypothetical protein